MYHLFRLLLRASYWKTIFRRGTWSEAGLSIRRFHKDRRARKHVLQTSLLLIGPLLCLVYLLWLIGSGAIYLVPFVVPLLWWRGRQAKRDIPVRVTPLPAPVVRELTGAEREAIRTSLSELALFYAIMTDRAGSESFLRTKVLPEGFEVTSRRRHLDLLREHHLWDRMSAPDRNAMLMADGHWELPLIEDVTLSLEQLRVLRWVLRLDYYLPTVGQQLRIDYRIAHELIQAPQTILQHKGLIELASLEVGATAAHHTFYCCIAEGVTRGIYKAAEESVAKWARDVVDELGGDHHEDVVIGSKIVSEVSDEDLRRAATLASHRLDLLRWIKNGLERGELPMSHLSVFTTSGEAAREDLPLQ